MKIIELINALFVRRNSIGLLSLLKMPFSIGIDWERGAGTCSTCTCST